MYWTGFWLYLALAKPTDLIANFRFNLPLHASRSPRSFVVFQTASVAYGDCAHQASP